MTWRSPGSSSSSIPADTSLLVARYAALICLLALLAGCGGDDERDAEQTVRDFVTALQKRDADTFCEELVTEDFLGQFSGATGDKARESCKRELENLTGV